MDTGERLAAYVAGELDSEEVSALEAELARTPGLRRALARHRRLAQTLEAMPPVDPPAGFSARLHGAVQAELDRLPVVDELTERRRRHQPRWMPALAGAAAVLVVLAGVVATLQLGAGDDAADESADTMMTAEVPEPSMAVGPVVVDDGRTYDAAGVESLATDERFNEIVEAGLTDAEAEQAAESYRSSAESGQAGDGGAAADAEPVEEAAGGAQDAPQPTAPMPAPLQVTGSREVDDEELAAVARCLDPLLAADDTLIPVYAELATFEDAPSIVYGLLARDPEDGSFSRVEIWVVERDTCEVTYFTQADRG